MKVKPKILIVGSTESTGGAAGVGWNIGEELRKRGYWVRYLVGYKKSNDRWVDQLRQPKLLQYLESKTDLSIPALVRHFRAFLFSDDMSFGANQEIFDHPWYKQADIIHLHNKHGNFIKLESLIRISKEKKLIWTLHDMWAITGHCAYTKNSSQKDHNPLDCERSAYPPILWSNDKRLWERKKKIYSQLQNITLAIPSRWLYDRVIQTPLKNHKIEIISNGIDTTYFKAKKVSKIRKKFNLGDKGIALFVAQGGIRNPRKNYPLFKGIAKELIHKNYIFISVGGSKKIKKIDNMLHIPFIKNKNEIAAYFQTADVVISSSKAEICALTLLESLLVDTPVISFDTGVANEAIAHKKTGYVMKDFKLESWVNATQDVLDNSARFRKNIINIKTELLKKYSVSTMVDGYIKIYEK